MKRARPRTTLGELRAAARVLERVEQRLLSALKDQVWGDRWIWGLLATTYRRAVVLRKRAHARLVACQRKERTR